MAKRKSRRRWKPRAPSPEKMARKLVECATDLSPREQRELADMLAQGAGIDEIAARRGEMRAKRGEVQADQWEAETRPTSGRKTDRGDGGPAPLPARYQINRTAEAWGPGGGLEHSTMIHDRQRNAYRYEARQRGKALAQEPRAVAAALGKPPPEKPPRKQRVSAKALHMANADHRANRAKLKLKKPKKSMI
jgi:hypothetical protein